MPLKILTAGNLAAGRGPGLGARRSLGRASAVRHRLRPHSPAVAAAPAAADRASAPARVSGAALRVAARATSAIAPPIAISAAPISIPRWNADSDEATIAASSAAASAAGTSLTSPPESGCSLASSIAACRLGAERLPGGALVERGARTEPRPPPRAPRSRAGPATRATALLTPEATPDVALLDRVEHRRGQRRDGHREPEAEEQHRRQHVGRGSSGRRSDGRAAASPTAAISGPSPSAIRGPIREASAPKRPESANISTVTGVVAAPAWNARVAGDLLQEQGDEEEGRRSSAA